MNQTARIVLAIVLVSLPLVAGGAEGPATFLGRPIAAWQADLASESMAERHLAAWSLAQLGGDAEQPLVDALGSDDPTVRYWGVHGLDRAGSRAPAESPERKRILAAMAARLSDSSPAVRIAAAAAQARLGEREAALRILVESLADPKDAVRIQAIDSLERLGPMAAAVRPEIEKATSDSSEYVKRISTRILSALPKQP